MLFNRKLLSSLYLTASLSGCGSSSSGGEADDGDNFPDGQQSTVVTGANLTDAKPDCVHSREVDSNFQNLSCRLILSSDTSSTEDENESNLSLLYDELNVVKAVEGVEIAWGVPPDLNFTCFSVKQSTEIFCFRESNDEIEDFNVVLTVTEIEDETNTIRAITTAVSSTVDQSTIPEAPSGLSATAVSSSQINLSFNDNSDSETQFSVERSLDNNSWGQITVIAANAISYANTGLSSSTLYYYRVKACNAAGCSDPSAVASDTTSSGGGSGHVLFVSSTLYNGDLGGLTGADAKCQARATAASLGGTWKAILSTSSVDAKDHINVTGEVRNTQGTKLSDNEPDLFDGALDSIVQYDEFGSSNGLNVWTGTQSDGTLSLSDSTCDDWSSSSGGENGTYGDSTSTFWLDSGTSTGCNIGNLRPIYCIDGQ
jgi:hypothetical protein